MSKFMSVVQETAWDVGVVYRVLFKMDIFHNHISTSDV